MSNRRRRAVNREPLLAKALIDPTSPVLKLVDEITALVEKSAQPSPMIVKLARLMIVGQCEHYIACQEAEEPFYASDKHGILCGSGRDGNKLLHGKACRSCKVGDPEDLYDLVNLPNDIQPTA